MRPFVEYARWWTLSRLSAAGRLLLACAVSVSLVAYTTPHVVAQEAPAEQRMLLEADQVEYDFDHKTVTAVGNVQIYYGQYALDAARVTYHQSTKRLVASGGVRMLEPGGNVITAESLDITDDFRDGFISELNVITPDQARFSADVAERRDDGELTIFRRGVYTACEPCMDHPERPPLWRIKAARIIHNRKKKTVYYEGARLEFLGVPVAYTPFFLHPDPTVKRKTGLLVPSVLQGDAIGTGVTTPFFWNLAPNYDVTFSPTFLTRQGVLAQAEWRHRLMNGSYSIRLSGIFQRDKGAFVDGGQRLSGYRDFRGSAHLAGSFSLSPQWSFGWDLHTITDSTFNRDYRIPDANVGDLPSSAYLTGRSDTNYFDLRGYYNLVQREDTTEDLPGGGTYTHDDQQEQALVHPVLDHNYIFAQPLLGGQVRLDSNLTSVTREQSDLRHPPAPFSTYYAGVAGSFTRATSRVSWRRRMIGPGGQIFTPFSYVQADANWLANDDPGSGVSSNSLLGRVMPAVGLEYEWPFLGTIGGSIHTFGPKVQIIARPNESHPGALPNEDSQSLVFDDTTLFAWDKFSGYDRQEGGVRANVGFTYQGLFPNGASVDALIGQSFQLAGSNSFALQDHALTGVGSGLDTDQSDIVTRLTVNTGFGFATTGRARLDNNDLTVNAADITAVAGYRGSTAALGYAYYRRSPAAGIFSRREELNSSATLRFADRWSLTGALVYDLRNESFVSRSLGIAYADQCIDLSATYSEVTDPYSDLVSDRRIFFRVNLRSLASSSFTSQLAADTQ